MREMIVMFLLYSAATIITQAQQWRRPVPSQDRNPVRWTVSALPLGKHSATVTLTAKIAAGWHIYSSTMENVGPVPTQITFRKNDSWVDQKLLIESGKTIRQYDSLYNITLEWHEDSVTYRKQIRLREKNVVVSGDITYMACKNDLCLPPAVFSFTIPIMRPATADKNIHP